MFCPACGNKIPDTSQFCTFCGAKTQFAASDESAGDTSTASDQTQYQTGGPPPPRPVRRFIPGDNFNIGKWWGEAWQVVMADTGPLVALGLLFWVAATLLNSTGVGFLVLPGVLAGFMIVIKDYIRRQGDADIGKMFTSGWPFFVDMLLFWLIGTVLSAIGVCCLIIPAIMINLAFNIAGFLIIDKNATFGEAVNAALALFGRHFGALIVFSLFLILIGIGMFILVLIPILGWAVLLILSLLLAPVFIVMYFKAYEDLFLVSGTETTE